MVDRCRVITIIRHSVLYDKVRVDNSAFYTFAIIPHTHTACQAFFQWIFLTCFSRPASYTISFSAHSPYTAPVPPISQPLTPNLLPYLDKTIHPEAISASAPSGIANQIWDFPYFFQYCKWFVCTLLPSPPYRPVSNSVSFSLSASHNLTLPPTRSSFLPSIRHAFCCIYGTNVPTKFQFFILSSCFY